LQLSAEILKADAKEVHKWWDKKLFDRILLDAPCSATGIIRRQPDIKIHRKPADIKQLAVTQLQLLEALWAALKPDGILLYATCSVLPEENQQIIEAFLAKHIKAELMPICFNELNSRNPQAVGLQLFPGFAEMDGFFYAKLRKQQ
jgi:16S rRNA (cytosine967-C5)-methyltransferase